MALGSAAWGVDLTAGVLKAVRVVRWGTSLRVEAAVSQPYAEPGEGAQTLSPHLPDRAARAVASFLQEFDGTFSDPVFVGLPTFGASHGQITIPSGTGEHRQQLLEFELRGALGERYGDSIVRVGTPRRRRTRDEPVYYFAQKRSRVHAFLGDLRALGLPLDGLVPEPIALWRYLELEWPGRGRRLAIQAMNTRTDLVYLGDRGPRFRSLPFGVGGLTGVALGSRTPPRSEVERLADRLLAEHRSAAARFFPGETDAPAELLILGEGARLASLRHSLQTRFGVPVATLSSLQRLKLSHRIADSVVLDVAQMGTALGLALGALQDRGEEYSLIPPPRVRKWHRLRLPLAVCALVLALAFITLHLQSAAHVANLRRLLLDSDHTDRWMNAQTGQQALRDGNRWTTYRFGLQRRALALHRQCDFPANLMTALTSPSLLARLRLTALRVQAGEDRDEVALECAIPRGLPAAARELEQWMQTHLKVAVAGVEDEPGEGQVLRLRAHGTLGSGAEP